MVTIKNQQSFVFGGFTTVAYHSNNDNGLLLNNEFDDFLDNDYNDNASFSSLQSNNSNNNNNNNNLNNAFIASYDNASFLFTLINPYKQYYY